MPRIPKPWRRKDSNGAWFAQIDKKQEPLAPPEATFEEALAALYVKLGQKAQGIAPAVTPGYTAGDVINLFLEHVAKSVARGDLQPVTEEGYQRFLVGALAKFGRLRAADVKPLHVQAWADADPPGWSATTRFNAITAVKTAFAWAKRVGHIDANPIVDMERPTPKRREAIPTAGQVFDVLDAIRDQEFRDLVVALIETGCRPGEVSSLEAAGVNLSAGTWTVANKTQHSTGARTRTIYLTELMVEMSRRLVSEHPEGPIFRNSNGEPWRRNAILWRFKRLRKRLGFGPELTAYAFRHGYITEGLERGVPIATLAELVGHSDTTMIMRVYSKLRERTEHMREAARQARQGKPPKT